MIASGGTGPRSPENVAVTYDAAPSAIASGSHGRRMPMLRTSRLGERAAGFGLELIRADAERGRGRREREDGDDDEQRRDQREGDRAADDARDEHGHAGRERADEADEGVLGGVLAQDRDRLLDDVRQWAREHALALTCSHGDVYPRPAEAGLIPCARRRGSPCTSSAGMRKSVGGGSQIRVSSQTAVAKATMRRLRRGS